MGQEKEGTNTRPERMMVCTQGEKWLCDARASLMNHNKKAENLLFLYDSPFILNVGKRWLCIE
jgi:hypothetical protein